MVEFGCDKRTEVDELKVAVVSMIRSKLSLVFVESSPSGASYELMDPGAGGNKICKKSHHQRLANVQMVFRCRYQASSGSGSQRTTS